MNNCITCKKNNKGDNWRNCRLKCHYKYEQRKKDEIYKLKKALSDIKEIVKEISYLGSRGERELKFKIKNILEEVIDEEIY